MTTCNDFRIARSLSDSASGRYLSVKREERKRFIAVHCGENHSLAFDAADGAGSKVRDEADLFADERGGVIVQSNAAHDGAVLQSVGKFELQEFLAFLHFLAGISNNSLLVSIFCALFCFSFLQFL